MPKVSVVIVNHNGGKALFRCLESLKKTQYDDFETLVVDNGSSDGSLGPVERMKQEFPKLSIITNGSNIGAAAGRNVGVAVSVGRYIAFLDSDTEVDPLWLEDPISTMEKNNDVGVVQCKLLLMHERSKYDYAGDFISQFGFLVQNVEFGDLDKSEIGQEDVFAVKSAGMVMRRDLFVEIGGFDESFSIYLEETDMCWRAWLRGYRVQFVAGSVVYHDFGNRNKLSSRKSKFLSKYHGPKNYLMMQVKNYEFGNVVRVMPVHLALWLGIIVWHLGRRRIQESSWIARGLLYDAIHIRELWRKRAFVQSRLRLVGDHVIIPQIMRRRPITYFYRKLSRPDSGWSL